MKCFIYRTSGMSDKPCDTAIESKIKDEDNEYKDWFVNIDRIEEIVKLSNDVESQILLSSSEGDTYLEIYDSYRE